MLEWKKIFRNREIYIAKINALPDNVHHLSRKDEIMNWFFANRIVENFVIIDNDTSLNDLPNSLKKHLILTSPYIGLTEDHLKAIESILHTNLQPE